MSTYPKLIDRVNLPCYDYNMMRYIRKVVYRLGYRPKLGSIFHSPSLNLVYAFRDNWVKGLKQGNDQATVHRVFREREEDQL